MSLTTLASVKEYIGETGTDLDALIATLITQIDEFVKGQLGGRVIEEAVNTDELHDGGEHDIFLNQWPIKAGEPFKIEFRSGPVATPTFTEFQDNDFVIYETLGTVHFFARTPRGETQQGTIPRSKGSLNIRVTYTAGFATVPGDLTLLANQLISMQLNKRNAFGIREEQVEGSRIEYAGGTTGEIGTELSAQQEAVLTRYRRFHVGENF